MNDIYPDDDDLMFAVNSVDINGPLPIVARVSWILHYVMMGADGMAQYNWSLSERDYDDDPS